MELYSTRVNGDVITEFVSGGAKNYNYKTRQESFNMDHVLWEGLYADRVRTNWCFGTKDQTRVSIFKVNALRFTLVMTRKHEG